MSGNAAYVPSPGIDDLPLVAWTVDQHGQLAYISSNAERLVGFTPAMLCELPSHNWLARVHPADLAALRSAWRDLFHHGERFDVDFRIQCPDDHWIWVHAQAVSTYERNGVRYADGILIDVTRRVQTERALRKTAGRLRVLTEHVADVVWLMDMDFRFTYVSPSVSEFLGYSQRELLSIPMSKLLTADSYALAKRVFRDRVAAYTAAPNVDGRPTLTQDLELRHVRKNGEIVWAEIRATLIVDDEGRPSEVLGITRNIHERKMSEISLRESEERFRLLFNSSQDAVYVVHASENGEVARFVEVNEIACERLGYTRNELLGMSLKDIVAPEDRPAIQDVVQRVHRDRHVLFERSYLTKSGERVPCEVNSHLFELRGAPAVISVARDVSARRHLEDQLRHAQKMEAVGRLAGGVAHDFNNLLTAILTLTELVYMGLAEDNPLRARLEELKAAADRAASLTRQLLVFSRKQVLQPVVLNVNTVVTDMERMLRRLIGEDIDLITDLDPHLHYVKADASQIAQVVLNLAVNARDAMPEGGRIVVATRNTQLAPGEVELPDLAPGRYALLTVTDTGLGMDTATRTRIFEPFYTTKEEGKGTGLGLSTVYGIVKQCNGGILVRSSPGNGAAFSIYLPEAKEAARPSETAADSAPDERGTGTILVVEDDSIVRRPIVKSLQMDGYRVFEASGPEQAIQMFGEIPGGIDLLVTDVIMPVMSGRDLAQMFSEQHPRGKVLFISGHTDELVVRQGVLSPRVPFLQKPFSMRTLITRVRDVLQGIQ